MGTTRIKVIDLSSSQQEIKTARKHAEKLSGAVKIKKDKTKAETIPASEIPTQEIQATLAQTQEMPVEQKDSIPDTKVKEGKNQPTPIVKKTKESPLKKHARHKGAKYQKAAALIEPKDYSPKEAFKLLPMTSFTKFDPTVEVHLGLSEKNIKVTVNMPHFKEKKDHHPKYLIFADQKTLPKEAQVIWGNEKTIAEVEKGSLKAGRDFTEVIASPQYMPKLAKIAKILGPKGLMPNPKNETVSENVEKFFDGSASLAGTTVKTDPTAPVIHTKIGKLSQKTTELEANFKALITAIGTTKIKKATLTTSMGPPIRLDPNKLTAAQ